MHTEAILDEARSLQTLDGVLRWALGRTPPAEFVDVIAQDEFSQDVIVRVGPGVFVVFDAT